MYLGIDVGGTKTLLAAFDAKGQILRQTKFDTPKKYPAFLDELKKNLTSFSDYHFHGACIAIPGKVDRKNGIGLVFGNLAWHNAPIKHDVSQLLGGKKLLVENDSNLAGLYEASVFANLYRKVLYMTISTGIGDGIIIDGQIDPDFADSEAGQMMLDYDGKLVRWEDIASGRALVDRYGQKARDITDPKIWRQFAKDLSLGLIELIAVMQPDVIIIGGSVGTHFEKYSDFLRAELGKHSNKMVKIPPIVKAKKPQEAVIYGCYTYIISQN